MWDIFINFAKIMRGAFILFQPVRRRDLWDSLRKSRNRRNE